MRSMGNVVTWVAMWVDRGEKSGFVINKNYAIVIGLISFIGLNTG